MLSGADVKAYMCPRGNFLPTVAKGSAFSSENILSEISAYQVMEPLWSVPDSTKVLKNWKISFSALLIEEQEVLLIGFF